MRNVEDIMLYEMYVGDCTVCNWQGAANIRFPARARLKKGMGETFCTIYFVSLEVLQNHFGYHGDWPSENGMLI